MVFCLLFFVINFSRVCVEYVRYRVMRVFVRFWGCGSVFSRFLGGSRLAEYGGEYVGRRYFFEVLEFSRGSRVFRFRMGKGLGFFFSSGYCWFYLELLIFYYFGILSERGGF